MPNTVEGNENCHFAKYKNVNLGELELKLTNILQGLPFKRPSFSRPSKDCFDLLNILKIYLKVI